MFLQSRFYRAVKRIGGRGTVALSLLALTACEGPFSILDPAGPSARTTAMLWWLMLSMFTTVFIAVMVLWWLAVSRHSAQSRSPASHSTLSAFDEQKPPISHSTWIVGGGIVLPLMAIGIILAIGIPAGYRLLPLPSHNETTVHIEVTGHQWWWQMHYPHSGITLRNELHIPIQTPIDLHLKTADVIHAFWVPRLGGKMDAIPGRTNILRLQADHPGIYRGQCAEFCGRHHAHMQFTVIAHSPEAFARWRQENSYHD